MLTVQHNYIENSKFIDELLLDADDDYDHSCGTIHITRKQVLVIQCALCSKIYGELQGLLQHLESKHDIVLDVKQQEQLPATTAAGEAEVTVENVWSESPAFEEEFISLSESAPQINIRVAALPITVKQEQANQADEKALIANVEDVNKKAQNVAEIELKPQLEVIKIEKPPLETLEEYSCTICGRTFNSRLNCQMHEKRHNSKKKHQCDYCDKAFLTSSEKNVHHRTHTGEKPYKCPQCDRGFVTSSHRAAHMRRHLKQEQQQEEIEHVEQQQQQQIKEEASENLHSNSTKQQDKAFSNNQLENPLQCKLCGKCFAYVRRLRIHMETHSEVRKYKCNYCEKSFKTHSSYYSHTIRHKNEKKHPCSYCDKVFYTRREMRRHLRSHADKPFVCNICGVSFFWASHLKEHMVQHEQLGTTVEELANAKVPPQHMNAATSAELNAKKQTARKAGRPAAADKAIVTIATCGIERLQCEQCGKCFSSVTSLKMHKETHSEARKYKCHICNAAFKNQTNCTAHVKRHNTKKDFKCDYCEKEFHTRREKRIHHAWHNNEKPYVCKFCGKAFLMSGHLSLHIKRHENVRPHKCNLCDKSFFLSGQLKNHLAVHANERNFRCAHCPAAFNHCRNLRRHEKLHAGGTALPHEFHCQECDGMFTNQQDFDKHTHFVPVTITVTEGGAGEH